VANPNSLKTFSITIFFRRSAIAPSVLVDAIN